MGLFRFLFLLHDAIYLCRGFSRCFVMSGYVDWDSL
jgi:hypothetical protein